MDKAIGVITAAGASRRMGTGVSKQLLSLCGRPVLEYSARAVLSAERTSCIILVVKPDRVSFFEQWCRELFGEQPWQVVPGGASRQESVRNGLAAAPRDAGLVVVHDGARPLAGPEMIDKTVERAAGVGAATTGVPVKDTVKETGASMRVVKTVPRENLWLVQTPQAFKFDVLWDAHRQAAEKGWTATDDAGLVEACGYPVAMVEGSYSNIKITTPDDMVVAEALMKAGNAY